MPNWCENKLRISHPDSLQLEKFRDAWNKGGVLSEFFPCPKELTDTMSGSFGRCETKSDQYAKELHDFQTSLNKKYFGYTDWYDWCVYEWGTKWDIGYRDGQGNHAEIEESPSGPFIEVDFDSAWSPPTGAYEKFVEMGFEVIAYYFEPGMGFCGRFDADGDATYTLREAKNIPRDIDDAFRILELMEEK